MANSIEFWDDYEVLTVETPENIELKLPLAGFGPRLLALVIDLLIQSAVAVVLVAVLLAVMAGMAGFGDADSGMFLFMLVAIIAVVMVTLGYYVLFEWLWNGQTPGKRITGIRVVKRGALPLSFVDVLLRNLLRLIDNMPSNYLIGLVSFFASANQQRLGDLVADTVVIREFTRQAPYTWVGSAPQTSAAPAGGLTPALVYVIGSYLSRAALLPEEVRWRLTRLIITDVGYDATNMDLAQRDSYLASLLEWQAGVRS